VKVLGLIIVLLVSAWWSIYFFQNRNHSGKSQPHSYKVMDQLEQQGIYGRDFQFDEIDGGSIKVNDFKGKVIIFSFWATWCEPCVEEFPSLVKLIDTFPDKIVLFAISHDEERKDVINFINAFDGHREAIKLVFDKNKEVSKALKVDRLPEGYIFDRQGKLVKKILGIQDWSNEGAIQYFKELSGSR